MRFFRSRIRFATFDAHGPIKMRVSKGGLQDGAHGPTQRERKEYAEQLATEEGGRARPISRVRGANRTPSYSEHAPPY